MRKIYPYSAIVTAYHEDETIDYDSTREQIRRQISHGNHILGCGTNGDFASLLTDEKIEIIKMCVEEAAGKVKVIINTGAPSTFQVLDFSERIADLGIDGIAVINPYFISCTQEGLYAHYSKIADQSQLPVYMYDIPARTQNGLEPETVVRLVDHENIMGIKDSSGNINHLDAYCAMASDTFEVLAGADSQIYHGLTKGASGCVSGLSNIVPGWVNAICTNYANGNIDEAEKIQEKLLNFRTKLYSFGFGPALVKRAVYVMNPSVGNNRTPSLVPSPELDAKLQELLDEFSITYEESGV